MTEEEVEKVYPEEDETICFICGAEAEFQISQTLANGIKQDYFLCEECFKRYKQIKSLGKLKDIEFWICVNGKTPKDYEKEVPVQKEYRFPFEVTLWKDEARRIILK